MRARARPRARRINFQNDFWIQRRFYLLRTGKQKSSLAFYSINKILYTVYQENQYFVKNMLLLKNPQFYPNHYETLSKWGPNEDFIFTKFRYDWVKIVDFLIKAYLWQSIDSPGTQCIIKNLVANLMRYLHKFYN